MISIPWQIVQANNYRVKEGEIGRITEPLHNMTVVLGGTPPENTGPIPPTRQGDVLVVKQGSIVPVACVKPSDSVGGAGGLIYRKEGVTQGDSIMMIVYGLEVLPLMR